MTATQVILIALSALAAGAIASAVVSTAIFRRTAKRRVERARAAEARARAAEHLAEVGALTQGLAHEIKNPLSTIGLNAQLLGEKITDLRLPEEDAAPLLRRLQGLGQEIDRLRGILSDFLEFAGELKLHTAPTDLNTLADELTDFFMPQARQLGIRIRCDAAPEPVIAAIDADHVKQAALNLMLNAAQAMAKQIDAARADPDAAHQPAELIIKVTAPQPTEDAEADPPMAALHIIDTGPGIPTDIKDQIFRPYFTTKGGGSGLGLPVTRRIVEAHQGRIEIFTEPGKGVDFTMRFPTNPSHHTA